MFRKNFEKSGGATSGGGGGGGFSGGGFGGGGFGGGIGTGVSSGPLGRGGVTGGPGTGLGVAGGLVGGGLARGPHQREVYHQPRRSRDHGPEGSFDRDGPYGAPAYRTHLLFSTLAGSAQDGADVEQQRYGPRRPSSGAGPHLIKWGGQPLAGNINANYTNNNAPGTATSPNNNSAQPQPVQRRKASSQQATRRITDDLPLTPTSAGRQVSNILQNLCIFVTHKLL